MKNIYHRAQIFVESYSTKFEGKLCAMSRMRPLDSIHCDLYVINFLKLADKSMTSVMEGKEGALLVGPTE